MQTTHSNEELAWEEDNQGPECHTGLNVTLHPEKARMLNNRATSMGRNIPRGRKLQSFKNGILINNK